MLSKMVNRRRLLAGCIQCQRNVSTINCGRTNQYRTLQPQYHIRSVAPMVCYRSISTETSSSLPTGEISSTASGFLPPPPNAPVLLDQVTALGEPTLASLGLGGYWPSGMVQSLLESIHVYCDLPWYGSVIALTVLIRAITLPITVMQLRNSANMNNNMPTMMKLQQQMLDAQKHKDFGQIERLSAEISEYTTRNDCSPVKMMLRPMVAAPVFISVFSALHGIADLPVEAFKTGGVAWFPNLTIADPYFILPAFSALTVAVVTMTGAEGATTTAMPKHLSIFVKILPVGIFAFTSFQPAVLALYWTTSNIISVTFGKVLRTEFFRNLLNIPEMIKHPPSETPDLSNMYSRSSISQQTTEYSRLVQLQHEMNERRQLGELKFKQSVKEGDKTESVSASEQQASIGSEKYDPTRVRTDNSAAKKRT